jgi:hypothetical protein
MREMKPIFGQVRALANLTKWQRSRDNANVAHRRRAERAHLA